MSHVITIRESQSRAVCAIVGPFAELGAAEIEEIRLLEETLPRGYTTSIDPLFVPGEIRGMPELAEFRRELAFG